MKKKYTSPIDINGVAALRALLGCDVSKIYAPNLCVDAENKEVSADKLSFLLENSSSGFLNISTDWMQTGFEDYHTFILEISEKPSDIPFGNKMIGPVSEYCCTVGRVNKIEIVQSTFEICATCENPPDEKVFEKIVYDRVLNIYGNKGSVSLCTERTFIEGKIIISTHPILSSDDEDETMIVLETLT